MLPIAKQVINAEKEARRAAAFINVAYAQIRELESDTMDDDELAQFASRSRVAANPRLRFRQSPSLRKL
jgi:hypothetical protein